MPIKSVGGGDSQLMHCTAHAVRIVTAKIIDKRIKPDSMRGFENIYRHRETPQFKELLRLLARLRKSVTILKNPGSD